MRTYALAARATLVVSVDGGAWQTIQFRAKDFRDIRKATAKEIAEVLTGSKVLDAWAEADGTLVMASPSRGGHASLTIDLANSTAAAALGISAPESRAAGSGLEAARLVGTTMEPFDVRPNDAFTIAVNGRKKKITFGRGIKAGKATAEQVVDAINKVVPGLAAVGRDGQVILTSSTVGLGSSLEVSGAPAAALGFAGAAGFRQPHRAEPARILCTGRSALLTAVNLTASPIELHFATGTTVLPARGSLPLAPVEAAHEPLQRLVRQGSVRLSEGSGQ
jgi:hypothetical protein